MPESSASIRQLGGRAVGLHTDTLQCLTGEKLMLPGETGEPIDLGRVGQVTRVDADLIAGFTRRQCDAGDSVIGCRCDWQLAERERGHGRRRRRRPTRRRISWCS